MTSWDILKKAGINSLPTDINIFINTLNIEIITYQEYSLFLNKSVSEIIKLQDNDGFTILNDNTYYIFYNDNISNLQRKRWTIMHEVSHILLGHITPGRPLKRSIIKDRLDIEADNLTARILAPSCILLLCGVKSATEVSRLCDISLEAGEHRYKHLLELYKKSKFFTNKKEIDIVEQFLPFIAKYICDNNFLK